MTPDRSPARTTPELAVDRHLPLTEPAYHILLALQDHDRHGYAILQEIERATAGVVVLRTGTLYNALRRLLAEGLLEETDTDPGADARRRTYAITPVGREVLAAEAARLERMVRLARSKTVLPSAGGSR